MLKLKNVHLSLEEESDQFLLKDLSIQYPRGHFGAIVGPSGCGKSTLIKVISGIHSHTSGEVLWDSRDLETEKDLDPGEIGYVPQFSIAFDRLTVRENVECTLKLRKRIKSRDLEGQVDLLLKTVGLLEFADRPTLVLSGGQKRRLALALELTSNPALLLCDEVTSGLDIKSEDQIVQLLRDLSRENSRIVLSVTHSLRHLDLYDSITVLYKGHLAYIGPPEMLLPYFKVSSIEDIYVRLAERTPEAWHERFEKARTDRDAHQEIAPPAPEHLDYSLPNPISQFWVLWCRRWKLFFREKGQLLLQFSLIAIFPAIVVIFAWNGLPQIRNLTMDNGSTVVDQLKEVISFTEQTSRVGGLVSGLIIFQVVLLTLMGANNTAREIVSERLLLEKEKLAGLSVGSYLASKIGFVLFLILAQSAWMTIFVKSICEFPGTLESQFLLLCLSNSAMTFVCLGISAWCKTPEQSSLISVYFVGFQLPLSGAVLAMPDLLGTVLRPLIVTYWGWSGMLHTIRETRFYDLVKSITSTPLTNTESCIWVLCVHIFIGLLFAYLGTWRSKWTE